jgi:hypothetical protein
MQFSQINGLEEAQEPKLQTNFIEKVGCFLQKIGFATFEVLIFFFILFFGFEFK